VVSVHAADKSSATPEPIPLDVLYEDRDLIVVDKPQGLLVHPNHIEKSGQYETDSPGISGRRRVRRSARTRPPARSPDLGGDRRRQDGPAHTGHYRSISVSDG
jgi:hypothetical protein